MCIYVKNITANFIPIRLKKMEP